MLSHKGILLNESDNVLVLPDGGEPGSEALGITLKGKIPPGHKAARLAIAAGDAVIKYGHPIGVAKQDIKPGEWVHEHNTGTKLGGSEESLPKRWGGKGRQCGAKPDGEVSFWGYERNWGRPGIRNDIWVIPTVGCINGEARSIADDFKKPDWIDAVRVLEHPYGCSQLGCDLEATIEILSGLALNPNAGGVLVLGLGCENLQTDALASRIAEKCPGRPFEVLEMQDSSAEEVSSKLEKLALDARGERSLFPISKLCVGVKCGGSDGYSGITANPLVGRFSDFLASQGGTVLATEIPEMFGAEDVIAERTQDEQVFRDFIKMDEWFRKYFRKHGQPIYENPSPGNKAGGITTLEEKSLGAVEKMGTACITRVLKYGWQIGKEAGVQIAFAPGNDLVSCSSLAGSGAQMVLFTTGRGTPYGTVVPTVKISTNSKLAQKHPGWIDFDAGALLDNESWSDAAKRLIDCVLRIASGEKAAHEKKGFGSIAIFKDGVTL